MEATKFELFIEGIKHHWNNQYINGAEIRRLGRLSDAEPLFQEVPEPWNDQLIAADHRVDLGRIGAERFFLRKKECITINKVTFEWKREYITGGQIRVLGKIGPDHEIFLQIEKPGKDELITEGSPVNVALPGIEHFYSKEPVREIMLIVNGTPKPWAKKTISFKELIILAFGNYIDRPTMVYTVGYEDGPLENPEGSMVRDTEVFVKNKMIFHATATDKS